MSKIETTLSVVIRPSEDIAQKILDVKKETSVSYPDHEDSFPHISLYFCNFNENNYADLINILKGAQIKSRKITLGDLDFTENKKRGYIFSSFSLVEMDELQKMHEQIVNLINPVRQGLVRYRDEERYKKGEMTEEDYDRTKKYGFQYFMDKYHPHITLGVIEKHESYRKELLKKKLGVLSGKTFIADSIFIRLKRRTVPEGDVVSKTDSVEISLN